MNHVDPVDSPRAHDRDARTGRDAATGQRRVKESRLDAPAGGATIGDNAALRVFGRSNQAVGRRVAYLVAVTLFSLITGATIVLVKLPIVIAGVASLVGLVLIVRNPYLGLLVYLVVYSMRLAEMVPALAPLRLERVLGVLTFGLLVLRQLYARGRIGFDSSRQTRHFYGLILAALISVPFAYWRLGAIFGTIVLVRFLTLYIMIVHIVDTKAKLRGFIYLQFATTAYVAVDSTMHYLHGALLHAQGIDRALGATSMAAGPNELGASMASTIPVFAFLALTRQLGRARIIFVCGFAVMLFTLVLTGSRSGLIGFVASMVLIWWRSKHRLVLGIVGIIMAIGLFAALPAQYKGRYETITTSELDGSSQERLKVWTKGLHMFATRPISGVGIGCFGAANAAAFSTGTRASWLESHSLYVQVPAEMGIIGVIAFFSFMFEFMRLNRRTEQALQEGGDEWAVERAVLAGMFSGFVALWFTGIFGHSLTRDTWYIYSAIGLATLRVYARTRPDLAEELRKNIFRGGSDSQRAAPDA